MVSHKGMHAAPECLMILPNESGNNMQGGGGGVERELLQTISSKIQQLIKNDNLVYAYRTLVLSYLAFPFSEFYFTPMSILIHSDRELGHMINDHDQAQYQQNQRACYIMVIMWSW